MAISGIQDAFVEIIVMRGLKGVRSTDPLDIKNRIYIFIQLYAWVTEPDVQPAGGNAIMARTIRRFPPSSIDPTMGCNKRHSSRNALPRSICT